MQLQKMPLFRRSTQGVLFLLLTGALAGFINGLLGAGGGILLVYMLRRATRKLHQASTTTAVFDSRDVYANALCVTLPISIFSATQYALAKSLNLKAFAPMILPALLGGIVGGWLLDRIKPSFLKQLFAWLVLVSGILMIVRS